MKAEYRQIEAKLLRIRIKKLNAIGLAIKNQVAMQNRGRSSVVPKTSSGSESSNNSSKQSSSGTQSYFSPYPPRSSTGPPVGALQAVQQVLATAAKQRDPHVIAASINYGRGIPFVSRPAPNTGLLMTCTRQMQTDQKPMSQMKPGAHNQMLNVGNVACWEASGYAQNSQPHQNPQTQLPPQMGIGQQVQIMGTGSVPNCNENSSMGSPWVIPNTAPSLGDMHSQPIQASQQCPHSFKSPTSARQQQQVLGVLKSNPQLMAAFMKRRIQHQQQQEMLINDGNIQPSHGGMQRKPTQAWQQLLQSFQSPESAEQQQKVLAILKSNPQPMDAFIKQRTQQQQQQEMLINDSNTPPSHGAMQQEPTQAWQQLLQAFQSPESAEQQQKVLAILQSNPQLMAAFIKQRTQQQQQQQQQEMLINDGNTPPSYGGMQRGPTQAWQQLLQALQSPESAEQQQQVLAILKSNPQLMTAFIKQRTQQQQQQEMLLNDENMIAPPPNKI